MDKLNELIDIGRQMIQSNVVIAPWLTRSDNQHRISSDLLRDIETKASAFADRYWRPDWQFHLAGVHRIPQETAKEAYYEIVSSTAVFLSHLELGTMTVTEEMVNVAVRLTDDIIERTDPQSFVTFYLLTVAYEDLQALQYYGSMTVQDFVKGDLHRPWGTATLSKELEGLTGAGVVEVVEGFDVVKLTAQGNEILEAIKQVFHESGFIKFRSRLIRLNNFNSLEDIEAIMNTLFPNARAERKKIVALSQIQSGTHVLELGCGTGALTFEAGLFAAVGPEGRLVATDPSVNMLKTVMRKREAYHAPWVEVVHAAAERIPFPDATFDSVIGTAFLHFTNIEEAVREIARVLKPGGTFTTVYPLHFPRRNEFFIEWFEPLLQMGTTQNQPDVLPGPDTVPRAMEPYFDEIHVYAVEGEFRYTSPQTVVEFLVDIGNVFEEQTATLPWQARKDLIEELIRRGETICKKYPPELLVEKHPGQIVRATVKSKDKY
ncbi:MAG: methyltransferase domain-containing protein [Alicyclobacillaceae bacterium]|nr:methyltransferase domain-containing protein [Alicyclobacillaceae bacterium]